MVKASKDLHGLPAAERLRAFASDLPGMLDGAPEAFINNFLIAAVTVLRAMKDKDFRVVLVSEQDIGEDEVQQAIQAVGTSVEDTVELLGSAYESLLDRLEEAQGAQTEVLH